MKVAIHAHPVFHFYLGAQAVELLRKLSKKHYDAHCRSISEPGRGSFLWGWHTLCDGADGAEVSASFRDLDTCLKLLEMPPPPHQLQAFMLSAFFRAILAESNRITPTWVHSFNYGDVHERADH